MDPPSDLAPALEAALGAPLLDLAPVPGGQRNQGFRVRVEGRDAPLFVRTLTRGARALAAEVAALTRLRGRAGAPALVASSAPGADPAWVCTAWVEGAPARQALAAGPAQRGVARRLGSWVAALGRVRFPAPGPLGPGGGRGEGTGAWLDARVRRWLEEDRLREALGVAGCASVRRWWTRHARQLEARRPEARLVHGDLSLDNVLVSPGRAPRPTGLVDWEWARAGDPLLDLGVLLRRGEGASPVFEQAFLAAYRAAGGLAPRDLPVRLGVVEMALQLEVLKIDGDAAAWPAARRRVEALLSEGPEAPRAAPPRGGARPAEGRREPGPAAARPRRPRSRRGPAR